MAGQRVVWWVGRPVAALSGPAPSWPLVCLPWGWGRGPESRSQLPSEHAERGPCPRPLVEPSLRHWQPGSSPVPVKQDTLLPLLSPPSLEEGVGWVLLVRL